MQAVYQAWDSQFFGKEIYELKLEGKETGNLSEFIQTYPPVFWQSQVDITDVTQINLLLRSGFTWASNTLKFAKTFLPINAEQRVLFKATAWDLQQVRQFVPGLYTDSRYHLKGFFAASDADKLYDTWLQRAFSGDFDDELLVCSKGGVATGFVTLKYLQQKARIGLIGVNPAYTAQGIGTCILNSLEAYCHKQGIHTISVQTQLSNLPAIGLYTKMGYEVTGIVSWFYKNGE